MWEGKNPNMLEPSGGGGCVDGCGGGDGDDDDDNDEDDDIMHGKYGSK